MLTARGPYFALGRGLSCNVVLAVEYIRPTRISQTGIIGAGDNRVDGGEPRRAPAARYELGFIEKLVVVLLLVEAYPTVLVFAEEECLVLGAGNHHGSIDKLESRLLQRGPFIGDFADMIVKGVLGGIVGIKIEARIAVAGEVICPAFVARNGQDGIDVIEPRLLHGGRVFSELGWGMDDAVVLHDARSPADPDVLIELEEVGVIAAVRAGLWEVECGTVDHV